MAVKKEKSVFICHNCGYQSPKWLGRCPECEGWSSFSEEAIQPPVKRVISGQTKAVFRLREIQHIEQKRIVTGLAELDRPLGGGIVPGAVILVGGDPGIGKSTLMLQMLGAIAEDHGLMYISGEESLAQIYDRAQRLQIKNRNILFSNENEVHHIQDIIEKNKSEIVVIDSIQTIFDAAQDSMAGNISQLRICTGILLKYAKENAVAIILIGHVTKEGAIAGPRILEHMVDTVIYFEGENQNDYRILRCTKNRFGSINEIGLFQMQAHGLEELANPSELFVADSDSEQSGDAIVAVMEGNRPFLVKVQALVTKTQFGLPQRTATGIDHRRMNLLLAVLEKRCGRPFGFHDVFLKTAGGLRMDEPAADLGICMALLSGIDNKPLMRGAVYIGEVGLGGEIRAVNRLEERISEARKLGFKRIVVPWARQMKPALSGPDIKPVKHLQELSHPPAKGAGER
jgi:DNA repair protein RadA/Sms